MDIMKTCFVLYFILICSDYIFIKKNKYNYLLASITVGVLNIRDGILCDYWVSKQL